MIRRLAIVGRGEPAVRLLNAVAELRGEGWPQLATVALFAEPDRQDAFVRVADEALCLGPPDGVAARLEAALVESGADAAWLGDNPAGTPDPAAFSELCARNGIAYVGPDPEPARHLFDPGGLRRLAAKLAIPVAQPTTADHADPAAASHRRRLEVAVIGDRHGNVVAPGITDASLRHQDETILEESAASLPGDLLETVRQSALRLCRAAGYTNSVTVAFRYDVEDPEPLLLSVRPQGGHSLTEATTGLDLSKLQLRLAAGESLTVDAPHASGHAIEVALRAEDPDEGFRRSHGRITHLRLPGGPGVRVDAAAQQDDEILPGYDPVIARLVAWGRDRAEALSRLRRALEQTTVVVDGGATNKSFLLSLANHPDVSAGRIDTGWLDAAMSRGEFSSSRFRPEALLVAAVEGAEAKEALMRDAFFSAASRGRPQLPPRIGQQVRFHFGGASYLIRVLRTGRRSYQVYAGGAAIPVRSEHIGKYERQVTVAGRRLHVHAVVNGPVHTIEIEGVAHRIVRDNHGIVRAPAPGVVVALPVRKGAEVAAGDTVAVLEMMKMETPVVAPFAGRVRAIPAALNVQVDAGARLVELEVKLPEVAGESGGPVDFAVLSTAAAGFVASEPEDAATEVFAGLRDYVLGYERDAADVAALLSGQKRAYESLPAGRGPLRDAEDSLLSAFSALCALSRRALDPSPSASELVRSPQQYLFTYLRSPARGADSLPKAFLDRLRDALRHFEVDGLAPSAALDDALLLTFRATQRLAQAMPVVAAILDRRLAQREWLSDNADPDSERALLDGLIEVAEGRYQTVADLAREVRFRWFDEPLLETARAGVYAQAAEELQLLHDNPTAPDRDAQIARLVACPQPLRPLLLRWYRRTDRPGREAVLEAAIRRYYRIRQLNDLTWAVSGEHQWCSAKYPEGDDLVEVVLAYTACQDLGDLLHAIDTHVHDVPAERRIVLDIHVWHDAQIATTDEADLLIHSQLDGVAGSLTRRPDRLSITVSDGAPIGAEGRTYHLSYRLDGGQLTADPLYRNMHPMLAERLEIWRLSNFDLERLDSVEDVYLFRGVAKTNPKDIRLFAVAEVRDTTTVLDGDGNVIAVPLMERMYLEALSAIRRYQSHRPEAQRLLQNQVLLYVRPPWTVPTSVATNLAQAPASASHGLGLAAVIVRVRIPEADGTLRPQELRVTNAAGVVVREAPPEGPVRVLSEYDWRALQTRRRGSYYPYEIVRMLTPPANSRSVLPPGDFVEFDLVSDDDLGPSGAGRLEPVQREYGANATNIVVGVLRNVTLDHPEGIARVVLLGDPSRGMGNLAEGECRRIMAACDLAESMQVPLEWFAVSSGAKISMSSGTENMDWISAVLRRLIEFTQAGCEVNVVVTGINVGAQPYWNAEATMLMHTKGILVMIPDTAMVLTGKTALDFSGGVSAEDNAGIGGYERVMGPNGQAQYYRPNLEAACQLLFQHYAHAYVTPGERFPRRAISSDPVDRDIRAFPHAHVPGVNFTEVGEIFSSETNAGRKKPFDIRSVMRAVSDVDSAPLERWTRMRNAESVVVWDARVGGIPVCLIGIESRPLARQGVLPADGPAVWTSGTLFPQSSRKTARAVNAASGNRPLVVLANLSGFDGSPESMRGAQLEYGAEIGRAITNFKGPIVFVVISRYHGGAFVVFSKQLNPRIEVAAVEGSYASVIGGAPAAAVVFTRDVVTRTREDERVASLTRTVAAADPAEVEALRAQLAAVTADVRAEKLGEVAEEFENIHTIERARTMGSVDRIISAADLRPYVVDALERGMAEEIRSPAGQA